MDGAPLPASPVAAGLEALNQPSRRRIADALRRHPDGLTVDAIADQVGLHPNAVRRHLRRLGAAGLLAAQRDDPAGRGRPSMRYTLAGVEVPRNAAHQELVRMLVGALSRTGATAEEVERFGRDYGLTLESRGGGADRIGEVFAQLGFAPTELTSARDRADGRLSIKLGHCPFREAVSAPGGELICHLHRGLAQGVAERAAATGRVVDLVVRDHNEAGCTMDFAGLHGPAPDDDDPAPAEAGRAPRDGD